MSFLYEKEPPPLRSTRWGANRTRVVISWFSSWPSKPISNAHIPPITIICQVLILLTHGGMEGWVNLLAVVLKLTTFPTRVRCASDWAIWLVHFSNAVSATAVLIRSVLCESHTVTMYLDVARQSKPPPPSKEVRRVGSQNGGSASWGGLQKYSRWSQAQNNFGCCTPSPRSRSRLGQVQVKSGQVRSGQVANMDGSDLTMIQVDLIQTDDYLADSCAINPTAFLFKHKLKLSKIDYSYELISWSHARTRCYVNIWCEHDAV